MARIFIVGATGLIGYHALTESLQRGYDVTALVRDTARAKQLLPAGVKLVEGDLNDTDEKALRKAMRGHEAMVFAAGMDERTTPHGDEFEFFYRANALAASKVFAAANAAGVRRAVLISSIFSYFHQLWPELRLASKHPYIRSRVFQEHHVLAASGEMESKILQLPFVFGAIDGRPPLLASLVSYLRSSLPKATTHGGANMVSIGLVAKAIVGAIETSHKGHFYQVGDKNLSWVEMMTLLSQLDGLPEPEFRLIGDDTFEYATKMGGRVKKLLNIKTGLETADISPLVTAELYFDPKPAMRALGYRSGGLKKAMSGMLAACD